MWDEVRKRLDLVDQWGKKPREFAKNQLYLNFPPYIYTIIAKTLIHQWI